MDAEISLIILKVLSKEASARYRTADQLGRVLMTFNEQLNLQPADVRPISKPVPSQPISQPSSKPLTSATTRQSPMPGGTTRQASTPLKPALSEAKPLPSPQETASAGENPLDIDWITLILGLLTFLAVGGLVPFCLWVYLVYNPLIK